MEYYVYELIDPRNDTVFYVGKGQLDRMYDHESQVKRGLVPNRSNVYLGYKIKKILITGLQIKYNKVLITENEQEAYNKERDLIETIGLKNLCNVSPGGIGSNGNKGRTFTAEHRKKISDSLKKGFLNGRIPSWEGKTHSDETKRKCAIAMVGNDHRKGQTTSEEHKRNLSISCKAIWKEKALNEGPRIPWNKGKPGYKKKKRK